MIKMEGINLLYAIRLECRKIWDDYTDDFNKEFQLPNEENVSCVEPNFSPDEKIPVSTLYLNLYDKVMYLTFKGIDLDLKETEKSILELKAWFFKTSNYKKNWLRFPAGDFYTNIDHIELVTNIWYYMEHHPKVENIMYFVKGFGYEIPTMIKLLGLGERELHLVLKYVEDQYLGGVCCNTAFPLFHILLGQLVRKKNK